MKIKKNNKTRTEKVICPFCKKRFYLTFTLVQPGAKGMGKIITQCIYCKELNEVELPNDYINEPLFKKQIQEIRKELGIN